MSLELRTKLFKLEQQLIDTAIGWHERPAQRAKILHAAVEEYYKCLSEMEQETIKQVIATLGEAS